MAQEARKPQAHSPSLLARLVGRPTDVDEPLGSISEAGSPLLSAYAAEVTTPNAVPMDCTPAASMDDVHAWVHGLNATEVTSTPDTGPNNSADTEEGSVA